MEKITYALIFVGAAIFAAFCMIRRHPVVAEEIRTKPGWRHLLLVTAAAFMAGSGGCSNEEPANLGSGPQPQEEENQIAKAWATLRTAWRQIDKYPADADDYKEFGEAQEAKKAQAGQAVDALSAAGALPGDVAEVLKSTFTSTVSSAVIRPSANKGPMVTCYDMTMIGAASVGAEAKIAESAMNLAELEKSGKLSPAVIEKARQQMLVNLQIIALSDRYHEGFSSSNLTQEQRQALERRVRQLSQGQKVVQPVPPEIRQAADVVMQLLTTDEIPK